MPLSLYSVIYVTSETFYAIDVGVKIIHVLTMAMVCTFLAMCGGSLLKWLVNFLFSLNLTFDDAYLSEKHVSPREQIEQDPEKLWKRNAYMVEVRRYIFGSISLLTVLYISYTQSLVVPVLFFDVVTWVGAGVYWWAVERIEKRLTEEQPAARRTEAPTETPPQESGPPTVQELREWHRVRQAERDRKLRTPEGKLEWLQEELERVSLQADRSGEAIDSLESELNDAHRRNDLACRALMELIGTRFIPINGNPERPEKLDPQLKDRIEEAFNRIFDGDLEWIGSGMVPIDRGTDLSEIALMEFTHASTGELTLVPMKLVGGFYMDENVPPSRFFIVSFWWRRNGNHTRPKLLQISAVVEGSIEDWRRLYTYQPDKVAA